MNQLRSKSLPLQRIGSVGANLCWAEAAYVVSEFYNPGSNGKFCEFLSRLFSDRDCCLPQVSCDCGGTVENSLEEGRVEFAELGAEWSLIRAEIEAGRPLLFENLSVVGHVSIVVGFMDHPGWQGVEVVDPEDHDFREIYLISLYSRLVNGAYLARPLYRQLSTRPKMGASFEVPGESWVETIWAESDLRSDEFERVLLPDVPDDAIDILVRFVAKWGKVGDSPPAIFPLWITESSRFSKRSAEAPDAYRGFFVSPKNNGRLAVDLFRSGGSYVVGKLASGDRLARNIARLKDILSGREVIVSSLYFERVVDLGLEVAYFRRSNVGRERAFLLGPRNYFSLLEDSTEIDAEDLRSNLARVAANYSSR